MKKLGKKHYMDILLIQLGICKKRKWEKNLKLVLLVVPYPGHQQEGKK